MIVIILMMKLMSKDTAGDMVTMLDLSKLLYRYSTASPDYSFFNREQAKAKTIDRKKRASNNGDGSDEKQ